LPISGEADVRRDARRAVRPGVLAGAAGGHRPGQGDGRVPLPAQEALRPPRCRRAEPLTTPSGTAWVRRLREADAVLFDFDGTLAPNLDLPGLRRRVVDLTLACGVPEAAFAGRYIVEVLDAGAG